MATYNPKLQSHALSWYYDSANYSQYNTDSFTAILADLLVMLVNKIAKRTLGQIDERSGNLIDSIGALLIVNGLSDPNSEKHESQDRFYPREQQSSGVHKGWRKYDIPPDTGRGYLDDYFDRLVEANRGTLGFKIYICAAAYYAQFLEDGSYKQDESGNYIGKKYKIISFSKELLEELLGHVAEAWSSRNGRKGSKTGGIRNFIISAIGTPYSIS